MIEPKNLLIVRTDRIGDVVLALPLAEFVKKRYPNCRVTYLIRKYTLCLVEGNPFIDHHILLKENANKAVIFENVRDIRKQNFDSCLIVYPTFRTALIIYLSGIKNRIGTGYRWYSFLFNHKIFEHRKYAEKHELQYNLNLLSVFGIEENVQPGKVSFNIKISAQSQEKINKLLNQHGFLLNRSIIIVHPGSGGSAVDLPIKSFKELIKLILEKIDAVVILTGSETEKHLCEQLVLSNEVLNFAGILTLSELIALTEKATLFISNSTGPLHIAAALNKQTIGFYPKILSCSANRWGPYSTKSKIFLPEINCSNCNTEQCERLDCMSSINMVNVFTEVQNLINLQKNNGENNA